MVLCVSAFRIGSQLLSQSLLELSGSFLTTKGLRSVIDILLSLVIYVILVNCSATIRVLSGPWRAHSFTVYFRLSILCCMLNMKQLPYFISSFLDCILESSIYLGHFMLDLWLMKAFLHILVLEVSRMRDHHGIWWRFVNSLRIIQSITCCREIFFFFVS